MSDIQTIPTTPPPQWVPKRATINPNPLYFDSPDIQNISCKLQNVQINSTENTSKKSAEEEIFEVEKIVHHTHEQKGSGKTPQPCTQNLELCYEKFVVGLMAGWTHDPGCYFVKWLNFPSADNTWEKANEKIEEVPDLVDEYWRDFCTRNGINRERVDGRIDLDENCENLTFDLTVEGFSRRNSELTKENTDLRSELLISDSEVVKIKSMLKKAETELVIAKNFEKSQVENLKFQLKMEKAKSQALSNVAHIMKNEFGKERERLIETHKLKIAAEIETRDKIEKRHSGIIAEMTSVLKLAERFNDMVDLTN
jgi:hypothetical protein